MNDILALSIELLIDIIEALVIIRFCYALMPSRYSQKVMIAWTGVLTLIIFIGDLLDFYFEWGNNLVFLITVLSIISVILFIFEDKLIKKLIVFFEVLIALLVAEGVTVGAMVIVFQVPTTVFVEPGVYRLTAMLISKALLFGLIQILITRRYQRGGYDLKTNYLALIVTMMLTNLVIMFAILPFMESVVYRTPDTLYSVEFLLIGLVIINIVMLLLIERIAVDTKTEAMREIELNQLKLQTRYMEESNEKTEEMRRIRHDMRNHIGNIEGLVRYKEYDQLSEYVKSLFDSVNQADEIILLESKAISAVLNRKYHEAKECDIDLKMDIRFDNKVNIKDIDLCIILGNLLDNAIEASMKLDIEERYIRFKLVESPDYVIVEVENHTTDDYVFNKNKYVTTKVEEKGFHGLGLTNVRQIVNKYNGTLDIVPKEGMFKVSLMLGQASSQSLDNL